MRVLHAACQAYCLGNSQINFYREVAPQAVDSSGSLSTHRLQLRRHCAGRDIMAWGAPRGVDDLIAKLKDNKTANTMCILSTRKFGATEAAALSAALASNTSLQELLASGHPLGAAEAAAFGEALSRNTTLRSLCLGDNSFGDEGVLALVAGLRSNRGLLVLDLEYKSVSSGEGLAALLETHPTLTDLRLGRNQLGEPGIKALSAGLSRNSTLLRLDLSGNKLDAAAADSLGRALCPSPSSSGGGVGVGGGGGPPPLEFLDVSKNPLGDEGGAALFRALAAAAAAAAAGGCGGGAASTLRVLRLAEADLGVGAAAALAAALSPAATGTGAGTGTGGGDAEAVSNAGGIWPLLETLDISKNELGTAGAAAMAGALARGGAPRLESLSVGYNGVGDEGAAAIGRAAGPALSVLDLSGSALSGAGIGAVMSASGLREAKLFHNECGDEGVPLVLEALLSGGKLKTLDLGANGLTGAGVEALLAGLGACPSLQTLEIGANSCDEIAEAAVRLSQSSNPSLDIAFRRGGEAMEGSGAPPGIDAAELQGGGGGLT